MQAIHCTHQRTEHLIVSAIDIFIRSSCSDKAALKSSIVIIFNFPSLAKMIELDGDDDEDEDKVEDER